MVVVEAVYILDMDYFEYVVYTCNKLYIWALVVHYV